MAMHSSILAWKIPWTKEPSGLQSIKLQSVRYYCVTEHAHVDIYIYIYISSIGLFLW